jgi:hypothetical protein
MINSIPVLGWIMSFIGYASMSVPFWYCWTYLEYGKKYFDFLPPKWQSIPFWDCVALCFCVVIIKSICTPHVATVSQTNNGG